MDFPEGRFGVIVADPPWQYNPNNTPKMEKNGRGSRAEWHYSTLSNEAIADLPIQDLAQSDAHLFMWITNPRMEGGRRGSGPNPFEIVNAWGFEYRTLLTWVKTTQTGELLKGGVGWYFRGATEHVLYCTRGKASIPTHLREPNVVFAPRGRHSEKPERFMQLVERVTEGYGPRIELFARNTREGWVSWGNQL